jgi:hypothetical protein
VPFPDCADVSSETSSAALSTGGSVTAVAGHPHFGHATAWVLT